MNHKYHFTKMHGLGNDFILIDGINQRINNDAYAPLAKSLCSRQFGVGADGLIMVLESDHSDFQMRIFNADGSEPEMCGNGIRCFAKFVYDNHFIEKDVITIETLAGIMVPGLIIKNGQVQAIEVDMGEPILNGADIPTTFTNDNPVLNKTLTINKKDYTFSAVSMGNPHAIFFVDNLKEINLKDLGPQIESHPTFPNKTNVEFIQVLSPQKALMLVWERGASETLACGTGSCASVVAGVLNNKLNRKTTVHLPGGELHIEWQEQDNHVMMTGPATTVYKGEVEITEQGELV